MENPKQAIYAPEELFALRPEPVKMVVVKPVTSPIVVNKEIPTIVVQPNTNKPNVWVKHKVVIIIGGIIFLGCIGLFLYSENKKVKKGDEEN